MRKPADRPSNGSAGVSQRSAARFEFFIEGEFCITCVMPTGRSCCFLSSVWERPCTLFKKRRPNRPNKRSMRRLRLNWGEFRGLWVRILAKTESSLQRTVYLLDERGAYRKRADNPINSIFSSKRYKKGCQAGRPSNLESFSQKTFQPPADISPLLSGAEVLALTLAEASGLFVPSKMSSTGLDTPYQEFSSM